MNPDETLRKTLTDRLVAHLSVLSITGDEAAMCALVVAEQRAAGTTVAQHGNSLVLHRFAAHDDRPLVLLVGHLDVVPTTDADRTPYATADRVVGRGSSDMKAGNVIALALFDDAELRDNSPYRVAVVLYAGEEGPASGNELADVIANEPWLTDADLAIVLEPTDSQIQLGCLGGLHAEVVFHGVAAHSARPWDGVNAVYSAHEFLSELAGDHTTAVMVDGVAFTDVWSVTRAYSTGFGPEAGDTPPVRNVIPDAFTLNLNFRFAPSRSSEAAEAELRARVNDRAEVRIVDRADPAPPHRDAPLIDRLVTCTNMPVTGKQAWTDVARFTAVGVPAVNFGPGLTAQAHQAGEYVRIDDMVTVYRMLRRFLEG